MSGSILKILACLAMLLDHTACCCPGEFPWMEDVLFNMGGKGITLQYLMRAIGRTAFPIFAFLISEGFVHTGNREKYALNLLVFALISEVPFNLAFGGTLLYPKQNVFFTLLLGYSGIYLYEKYKEAKVGKYLLGLVVLFVVSMFLRADYGCFGYGFILLLYILRTNKVLMSIIGVCVLPSKWIGGAAFLPICMYNGKRGFATGKVAKYAFYLFYPLHLFMIYLLRIL